MHQERKRNSELKRVLLEHSVLPKHLIEVVILHVLNLEDIQLLLYMYDTLCSEVSFKFTVFNQDIQHYINKKNKVCGYFPRTDFYINELKTLDMSTTRFQGHIEAFQNNLMNETLQSVKIKMIREYNNIGSDRATRFKMKRYIKNKIEYIKQPSIDSTFYDYLNEFAEAIDKIALCLLYKFIG